MTIGGAISDLNNLLKADDIPIYYKPSIKKIIETIEQESCEDSVSRDAVHNMLEHVPIGFNDKWYNWLQKACLRLAELPSVTPKQRTGKWIFKYGAYTCDECGCRESNRTNYCSNCGAKMGEDSE